MKSPSRRYVVLSLALTLGGCNDNSDPVRPAPVTPPTVQYLDFSIAPEIGRPTAVNFIAVGGKLADRFEIEVGSTSGASDLGVLSFGAQKDNAFTWTLAPIGTLFARARAENAAGSSPGPRYSGRSASPGRTGDCAEVAVGKHTELGPGPDVEFSGREC